MTENNTSFSDRHPRISVFLGLIILLVMVVGAGYFGWLILQLFIDAIEQGISLLKKIATTLDAVVIVALITGCVSITGVIISSIISKVLEYQKNRQDYLARKREAPYGDFIE